MKRVFATTSDLSGKDGYAVKHAGGVLAVCSAITDQAVGICIKGGTVAQAQTEVLIHGEGQAILGGTVTAGQMLTPHTDSTLVASAGAGCTEFALALESGVAGDWVNVFVLGGHKQWA